MNRKIGMAGSAIAGIAVLCFAICMLVNFNFGSYLVCMFLAIGYVMMIAAFQTECNAKRKAAGNSGLAFAVVYAVLILLVYFAQNTSVRLDSLNDSAMHLLDFQRFGLMFNYDLLGYGMMALSTFFTGLTIVPANKRDKALKWLMLIHGVFFISCFVMPMLGVFSEDSGNTGFMGTLALEVWCVYFLPVTILAYFHFRGRKRS